MRGREDPALVAVVLYDGVEPIDVGGTVGVISMASRILPRLRAVTVAEHSGPVRCAHGLVVEAAHGFDDLPPVDAVIVTGGPGWRREAGNPAMLDFLRRQGAARVGSVCTGALIVVAAGLLSGQPATTRRTAAPGEADSPLDLLSRAGAAALAAQIADPDPGRVPWSSGGVSLAIDGTLHLIARLYDVEAREELAQLIEYDRAWEANALHLGQVMPTRSG